MFEGLHFSTWWMLHGHSSRALKKRCISLGREAAMVVWWRLLEGSGWEVKTLPWANCSHWKKWDLQWRGGTALNPWQKWWQRCHVKSKGSSCSWCIAKNHLRCGKPTARKAELEKALRMSMMHVFHGHVSSKLFWWTLQPLQPQLGHGPTSQEKP